ncbi:uncharacterized protein [Rutidosis leptorrhynchoides]|uniref:uncharacterized protein n=1 Tax=Rutidosis leptorrhynchoides TaxID=125765 RepID=UPI003A991859
MLKRLPVRTELDKRGIDLDSVRCPNCNNEVDTVEHMILKCQKIKDLWCRVFKWANLGNMSYSDIGDMFLGKLHSSNSTAFSKIWQTIEWVAGYSIWRNRKEKTFKNKDWSVPMLLNEIQVKSFMWVASRLKIKKIEWTQWLLNPCIYDDHG